MKPKHLFSMALLLFAFAQAVAQTPTPPKITPSSPSAAALMKFGEYPVSLYTGTVSTEVPIYTIEDDGIKVPISLKYHGSGIRYDDASMAVGIGWTLFAGGMITYEQRGLNDRDNPNRFNKLIGSIDPVDYGTTSINDNHSMIDVVSGNKDSEYDVYNFSFLNYSGKFFYPGTTNPVFSPRQNLKVNLDAGTSKFPATIIDEDGIAYKFGPDMEFPNGFTFSSFNVMLKEIVSADKSDTVKFNYTSLWTDFSGAGQMAGKFVIEDYVTVRDNRTGAGGSSDMGVHPTGSPHALKPFGFSRLDNITFKGGKILFSYDVNNRLTAVTVYNNTDSSPTKVVTMHQSAYGEYFKLDSVRFRDGMMSRSNSYKFKYKGTPNAKISGLDYWGYYNGTAEPTYYVPNFEISVSGVTQHIDYGTADRTPNESEMMKGILDTIYYPTGGHTIFTYEAHRYGTSAAIAGGLRIKSIDNYDAANNFINKKWYSYGQGIIHSEIHPEDYCFTTLYGMAINQVTHFDYTLRERTYSAFPAYSNMVQGSSVVYTQVTEYTGDGTNANGKTEYNYEHFDDQLSRTSGGGGGSGAIIPMLTKSYGWKTGNLVSKIASKYVSGTGYVEVSRTVNTYKDLNYQEYANLKVMRYLIWPQPTFDNGGMGRDLILEVFSHSSAFPVYNLFLTSPFMYANYWQSSGTRVLDSVVTITDGVSTMTRYKYNGTYDKPDTVITRHTDGTFSVARMTYPFNKSGTVYTGMVTANIINPVIDQEEYKTSTATFLKSTTTDWDSWSGGFYKPKTVSTKTGTAAAEVRLRYGGYDGSGNVQTVAKEGGPKTTYIWSYRGTYPVAEIQNSDSSAVITALGGTTAVRNFRNSNPTDAELILFLAPLRTASSLANAMVTTYTYQPLVGVTSSTDPKGLTTYYEYDGFNRLSIVRDKDGNIVKAICYNYKGEPTTNCYVPASRNIYARLEYTNYTYPNIPNGTTIDYYTYADMTLKLYADAACTQPFSFNTSTSVQIKVNLTAYDDVSGTTVNSVSNTINVTVPANTSTKAIGNQLLQHLHTYTDEYDNWWWDRYDFYPTITTPTTGNLFVVAP